MRLSPCHSAVPLTTRFGLDISRYLLSCVKYSQFLKLRFIVGLWYFHLDALETYIFSRDLRYVI